MNNLNNKIDELQDAIIEMNTKIRALEGQLTILKQTKEKIANELIPLLKKEKQQAIDSYLRKK